MTDLRDVRAVFDDSLPLSFRCSKCLAEVARADSDKPLRGVVVVCPCGTMNVLRSGRKPNAQ